MEQKNLLQILVDFGVFKESVAKKIQQQAAKDGLSIVQVIQDRGDVSEEDLARAKGELFNIPYQDLTEKNVDKDIVSIIPETVATTYQAVCFAKEDNLLSIGLVNPQNLKALEAIEFLVKEKEFLAEYFIISKSSFENITNKYKALGDEVEAVLQQAEEQLKDEYGLEETADLGDIKKAPVSKIVNTIMKDAIDAGASDIHIEPTRDGTRIRYRVDGILHEKIRLPSYIHNSVISRIKVLANLKLDETRKPQDGRIKTTIGKLDVDLRVSVLPLIDTEKIVMRVLDTSGKVLKLDVLGFREEFVEMIEASVKKSHGLILVTGPTGAGKSTTLYSVLGLLNGDDINISTLEDPVEKFILGVNQSQVNSEVGFTFASGLRALLRQDPNVIMVGEIRDGETAELSVHAALTGHVVFATLHTNDAFGAIPRLIDMHVEPFLLVSTLELVMAQRLVRTICPDCKEKMPLPEDLMFTVRDEMKRVPKKYLPKEYTDDQELFVYQGTGCAKCGNTGYRGRTTIAEIILMTDMLRKAVTGGNKIDDIDAALQDQDMLSMKQDGILKALEGTTTMQDVLRVMQE